MPYFGNDTSVLDRRILRMEFDNQKFEKNIAKSQKSVEDFKKVMNFDDTTRGLERFSEAANNISFDRMESYLERLADKFTGIGDAGEYMVSRVRSAIEGMAGKVESFAKSLSLDQINVGQSKYDALNKAVMTITADGKYSAEQAYSVFERLMTYTNETSYSFADMVNQISAFTAAGQGLKSSERAMEGIANATAKAGQGVSQATSAMQVFSKAMGAGYLRLDQWNSLNLTSHMITEEFRKTLVETAVEVGTLKQVGDKYVVASNNKLSMTMQNLETTLHAGWANRNVLMKTLEKYYFEEIDNPEADWNTFAGQAAKAAQRALSLADALNAMKEAVSAGWMTSFRLFWGDLADAMSTFTNIANRVIEILDRISEWRNSILKSWVNIGGRTSFLRTILGDYGQDVTDGSIGLVDLLEKAGDFIATGLKNFFKIFVPEHLRQYWDKEGFQEAFLGGMLFTVTQKVSSFFKAIDDFFNGNVITGTGEAKTRLQVFTEIVNGISGAFAIGYNIVSGIVSFISNIAGQLGTSVDAIIAFFGNLGSAIYGTAEDVTQSGSLIMFFRDLAIVVEPITSGINAIVNAFIGMLNVLLRVDSSSDDSKTIFMVIGNTIKSLASVITTVGKPILDFFTSFFTSVTEFFQNGISPDSLIKVFNSVKSALSKLFSDIKGFFKFGGDSESGENGGFLSRVIRWFTASFENVKEFFKGDLISKIQSKLTDVVKRLSALKDKLTNIFGAKLSEIMAWLWDKAIGINWWLVGFGGIMAAVIAGVVKLITTIKSGLDSVSGAGAVTQSNTVEKFIRIAANVGLIIGAILLLRYLPWDGVANLFPGGSVGEKFLQVLNGISDFLSKINWWAVGAVVLVGYVVLKVGQVISAAVYVVKNISDTIYDLSSVLKKGIKIQPSVVQDKASKMKQIAEAVAILVGSVLLLANQPYHKVDKALAAVALLMVGLGAFIVVVNKMVGKMDAKITYSIAGIVLGIDALIFALLPLAFIPEEGLQRMGIGLVSILGVLSVFTLVMRLITSKLGGGLSNKALSGISSLAKGIALIIAVLLPIGLIKDLNLDQMLLALGGLLAELWLFVWAVNGLAKGGLSKRALAGIVDLAKGVALLVLFTLPLAFMNPGQITQMSLGLGAMLGAIVTFAFLIKKIGSTGLKQDTLGGVVDLAKAVALIMVIFTGSLLLTQNIPWERVLSFATGITIVMLGIAGMIYILSKVDFVKGLAGVALVAIFVAALIGIVGALTPWLMGQAASGLQQAGGKLANASDTIGKFASSMAGIGDGNMDHAYNLIMRVKDILLAISSAGALSGNISNFTTNLFDLGVTVRDFADDLSGANGAGDAVGMIQRLANSYSGLKNIAGLKLDGFTTSLTGLGGAMSIYAEGASKMATVADPGKGNRPTVQRAIEILEELSEGIIAHGGFKIPTDLPDADTIGLFGGQLAALAMAMVNFEDAGSKLGTGTDKALETLDLLSGIEQKLNGITDFNGTIGYFAQYEVDDEKLTKFAHNIQLLGEGLAKFAESTTKTNQQTGKVEALDFSVAISTLDSLVSMNTTLTDTGTFWAWLSGKTDQLGSLAGNIQSLSSALGSFQSAANELKGKVASRDEALGALEAFVDFINGKDGKGGLKAKIVEMYSTAIVTDLHTGFARSIVAQLAEDMAAVGTNLATYGQQLSTVKWAKEEPNFAAAMTSMDNFISAVERIKGRIESIYTTAEEFDGYYLTYGEPSFVKMSEDMFTVAKNLADYGKTLGSVNFVAGFVNQWFAIAALETFVNTVYRMKDKIIEVYSASGSLHDAYGQEINIVTVSGDMEAVGENLTKFGESLAKVDFKGQKENQDAAFAALTDYINYVRKLRRAVNKADTAGDNFHSEAKPLADLGDSGDLAILSKDMGDIGTNLGAFSEGLKNFKFDAKTGNVKAAMDAIDSYISYTTQLNEKLPKAEGAFARFWKWLTEGNQLTVTDMSDEMATVGENLGAFGESIKGKFKDVKVEDVQVVITALQGFADILNTMQYLYAANQFADMPASPVVLADNLEQFILAFTDGVKSLDGGDAGKAGDKISLIDDFVSLMIKISDKINQTKGFNSQAITSFRDLAQALVFISQTDTKKNFILIGESISTGIAEGIAKGQDTVFTAGTGLIDKLVEVVRERAKVNSPSKVFAELGMYFDQGLALGVTDNTGSVIEAVTGMSDEAIDGASGILAKVSKALSESVDTNPTITPVLDLTGVTNGLNYLDRQMYDRGFGIDVSGQAAFASRINGLGNSIENQNGTLDMSGVYSHIDQLGIQITDMGEAIRNIQLVLDTGVLAGAVTDKIDKNLGLKAFYTGRRN